MKNLVLLITKECRESIKEYKFLWIPIVFILASIMQPITMQLIPKVIDGNNALIMNPDYTTPSGNNVFSGVFGQLNQFAIFTIVVTLMSCIINEKKSGVLELLFTKPITKTQYLLSKYIFYNLLFIISLGIGLVAGLYYTNSYYSSVDITLFLKGTLFYTIWLWFLVNIGIMASSIFRSHIQAALFIFIIPIVCLILNNFKYVPLEIINPGSLSKNAISIMVNEDLSAYWQLNILGVVFISGVCMYISYYYMKITDKG